MEQYQPKLIQLFSNAATWIQSDKLFAQHREITFSMNPSFSSGATYAADYSANFTDRSLVDKGYVDSVTSGATQSKGAEYEGNAISGFTGGTGVIASDPFGTDTIDTEVKPAVYLNGVKYKVGDGTTAGKDAWFADAGTPGTAKSFSTLSNTDILVWSAANSTIDIDTADYVWVTYGKLV